MTRINTIPVKELTRMHLQGELKEITRVFGLVRKAQQRGKNKWNYGIPKEYTMGTGHVKFFADKLLYILNRYHELVDEMRARGYKPNPIPDEDLLEGIDKSWMGDYTPTEDAIKINRARIEERLKEMSNV
jgi:hypothetical protein